MELQERGDRCWYQVALIQMGKTRYSQEAKSTAQRSDEGKRAEEAAGAPAGWMRDGQLENGRG